MDRPGKQRAGGLFLQAQHQLRQPLNALGLLIGELRQARGERDIAEIADDMRYALQLSIDWLNGLTELDQAEQNLIAPRAQAIALQPLFEQLREDFAARFAERDLDFRIVRTGATVLADPLFLRRTLAVLLDNAAKFTSSGRVLLGCRRDGADCRIEVWDSGAGITEADQEQLFEPFFRLENEVRPRERGLGLGLAYAQALAELTGDRLTVISRPGVGSCFAVTLRGGAAEDVGAPAAEERYADGVPAAVLDHLTNPLDGADVVLLEGRIVGEVAPILAGWGAQAHVVPAGNLAEVRAAGARLVIADASDFAAAGGWTSAGAEGAAVVLVADEPLQSTGNLPGVVHFLRRPIKPARLRALCHFALAPPAS